MKDIIFYIIGTVLAIILIAFFITFLWNWLLVELFSFPSINILQGLGIFVLCNLLFNNSGKGESNK